MPFAVRMEVLKAALADDETRLKIDLALDANEMEKILMDFARKKGFKVLDLNAKPVEVTA